MKTSAGYEIIYFFVTSLFAVDESTSYLRRTISTLCKLRIAITCLLKYLETNLSTNLLITDCSN